MGDELVVRITAVGHASRRWKSAKNATEADHLNQRLSELRAQNVRKAVEDIIKKELPTLKIEVPSKGVGSHMTFATANEDNAAVDRSVIVMVDLTHSFSTIKLQTHPPRRVYVPSKDWTLKVVAMVNASAVGFGTVFLRVIVRNSLSGKEITLAGWLLGGELGVPTAKNLFKFDKRDPTRFGKPIGNEVYFTTKEAFDFDDWIGNGKDKGQWARLVHSHLKTGLTKSLTTFLQFTGIDTDPGSLVFEYKGLGLGLSMPDVDVYVKSGKLYVEGNSPGDIVEIPVLDDIIPIQVTHPYYDGLLLSFPTGKAKLHDLTNDDRKRLTEFVTNQARTIAGLASLDFNVSAPHP